MIHPDTEIRFISKEIGYGVVAKKLIPKGTITWVQDELDQIYPPEAVAALSPFMKTYLDTYCFINRKGEKVLCWDYGKYVNHSFNPSCFTTPFDFEIAIRDIHPGEELTDDYGYLNIEKPFAACDEGTDRKVVYPHDLLTYHQEWDEMLRQKMPFVFQVPQPLSKFIDQETWEVFKKVEFNIEGLPSLLESHFQTIEPQSLR